jgi:PhzF family phenazine biosynthesis protein
MARSFAQVDVFSREPYLGNPVAVVLDGEGIADVDMQRFARWTNLSETTFVLPTTRTDADYRVRIFTPEEELPFAGHPTLGTCHAWLEAGGVPRDPGVVVQECPAGLIPIRRGEGGLTFAAPPLIRSGPVDEDFIAQIAEGLRIERGSILDAQWVDNGPGWVAVLLSDTEAVLSLSPGAMDVKLGVVALADPGSPHAIDVRAFFPVNGVATEDPVTGSLNASLASWLLDSGRLESPYIARQGTVLGRDGAVSIARDDDGTIWVGGATVTCIEGTVTIADVVSDT